MEIEKLRQSGLFKIMILLLEEDKKTTDITQKVASPTAYRVFRILLDLALATVERREYNTKYYCLTAKGKKIATKLTEIEKILQEET